jgi:hypothetical protein
MYRSIKVRKANDIAPTVLSFHPTLKHATVVRCRVLIIVIFVSISS